MELGKLKQNPISISKSFDRQRGEKNPADRGYRGEYTKSDEVEKKGGKKMSRFESR